MRYELLDTELFGNLHEAKVIVEQWRQEYNHKRPHSSLGSLPPAKFAANCIPAVSATPPPSKYNLLTNDDYLVSFCPPIYKYLSFNSLGPQEAAKNLAKWELNGIIQLS